MLSKVANYTAIKAASILSVRPITVEAKQVKSILKLSSGLQ